MAGMNDPAARSLPVVSCCAPEKQPDCCAPAEKAKCCPPDVNECGCQASAKG